MSASAFGRKYEIKVFLPATNGERELLTLASSDFKDPLRIVFDCQTVRFQSYWCGEVTIYNLDWNTTDKLLATGRQVQTQSGPDIMPGAQVVISAGYEKGFYGEIFNAFVLQPTWERENVVDFKLTLQLALPLFGENLISTSFAAGATQADIVRHIAAQCFKGIPLSLSPSLDQKRYHRARTLFGDPRKYLDDIAVDNNMQWWLSTKGLSMGPAVEKDAPLNPTIVYTPETGIIGTPVQTDKGVTFTVLMDHRIQCQNPSMQVKIDNSSIRQAKAKIGMGNKFVPLSEDGIYHVVGVRHYGDNRGNDWYSEIDGVNSNWYTSWLQTFGQEAPAATP